MPAYNTTKNIRMVDLQGQYRKIKTEIDQAITSCLEETAFINGPQVKQLESALQQFAVIDHVISCGNGTDALQIALMALDLQAGDEVIVPAFTYAATAEAIALCGLTPVIVDVDPDFFTIAPEAIKKAITSKTRALIPVHLFGQCADMEAIMQIAKQSDLIVIEDTAQAIGASYTFSNGIVKQAGTIGHIGCFSFFPTKNLGCYGDGGAVFTNNAALADTIRKIANHGQSKKYYHERVGMNSRLDTIQAAILKVKLHYLPEYMQARKAVAGAYDKAFDKIPGLHIPMRNSRSTHVFNQYTLKIEPSSRRNMLKEFLSSKEIPSVIYYPVPLHLQEAYKSSRYKKGDMPVAEALCESVLSLPMHTELDQKQVNYITQTVAGFLKEKQYA